MVWQDYTECVTGSVITGNQWK